MILGSDRFVSVTAVTWIVVIGTAAAAGVLLESGALGVAMGLVVGALVWIVALTIAERE